jgi:hypothetical protein
MKILEIIRDVKNLTIPAIFRVGAPVVEGGHIVSEILYCRDGYSSGSKGRRASYAVKFVDSTEVRVIPETEIIDMAILPDETSKDKKSTVNPEATIPLPD